MRKATLFCILSVILLAALSGCVKTPGMETSESSSQPDSETSESSSQPDSETSPSLRATATQQGNVFNEDGSIRINVYVNDTLMDVKAYDDNPPPVEGPNNFGNFTQAGSIMDFLGISYEIDEAKDSITLTSEQYGTMDFSYRTDTRTFDGELYMHFYHFRVYTDGSLKQDDYASMYLYTGDYERTDLPETLEECYVMLDEILDPEDIQYLRNATDEDLAMQHFGLGLWIRNNWLYPTQSKLAELLFENGVSDIDSMSSLILRGYVAYLNGQPCGLKDMLPKGCPLPDSI